MPQNKNWLCSQTQLHVNILNVKWLTQEWEILWLTQGCWFVSFNLTWLQLCFISPYNICQYLFWCLNLGFFCICNILKAALHFYSSIETTKYTGIFGPRWFWFGRRLCAFRSFIIPREVKWTTKDNVALSDCWAPTDWPLGLPSRGEKFSHFWYKCIIKEYYCNGIDIKAIENSIERPVSTHPSPFAISSASTPRVANTVRVFLVMSAWTFHISILRHKFTPILPN